MPQPCKHTVVRVVAREEDTEFVECQACGEIFDAIEYEDMAREEAAEAEAARVEAARREALGTEAESNGNGNEAHPPARSTANEAGHRNNPLNIPRITL